MRKKLDFPYFMSMAEYTRTNRVFKIPCIADAGDFTCFQKYDNYQNTISRIHPTISRKWGSLSFPSDGQEKL